MVPFAPPLFAEELLSGYWLRSQCLTKDMSPRQLAGAALGGSWRSFDIGLPSHLTSFFDTTGNAIVSSVDVLIERHTLFPLYAVGLGTSRRSLLRTRMLKTSSMGPIHPFQRMAILGVDDGGIRSCASCNNEGVQAFGHQISLRIHQSPGLSICPRHSEPLQVQRDGEPCDQLRLRLTSQTLENESRIASAYRDFLMLNGEEVSQFRKTLVDRARSITRLGGCVADALARLISQRFAGGFPGSELSSWIVTPTFVQRMLSRFTGTRADLHPLFMALLDASLPDGTRQAQVCAEQSLLEEADLSDRLMSFPSLTKASSCLGVDVTTLSVHARRAGLPFSYRPSRLTNEVRERAKESLFAGEKVFVVARSLRLSVESIYRVLRACPDLRDHRARLVLDRSRVVNRAKWLSLRREHVLATISEVRRLAPATYAWLYKNDREWLQDFSRASRLAGSTKARSGSRDAEMTMQRLTSMHIARASWSLGAPGAPRLSRTRLLAIAGLHGSGTSSPNRRAIDQAAKSLEESFRAFAERRLVRAAAALAEGGEVMTVSKLVRNSGLRTTSFARANLDVDEWLASYIRGVPA